jgi:hypothetical protein
MKTLFCHLVLLFATFKLFAQEEKEIPQAGFLNVVNLIAMKTPTFIEFGGFPLNGGEAVAPGDNSGVLAVKPNTYSLTISNEGAKPKKVSGGFVLQNGKTVAIICYDEVKEYKDGSKETKLRFNVLVEEEERSGPRLSLVSLLKEPLAGIKVSGETVTLAPGGVFRDDLEIGQRVSVSHEEKSLADFEITKPIHVIGFFYRDPGSGEISLSLIQNEKLEYHPPLDPEEDEE